MSQLCERLEEHVPEIIGELKHLTDRPPWTELTTSERRDHLPTLLKAMIEAAVCGTSHHPARELVVRAAAEHGEQRQRDGFDRGSLLDEHYLLRTAVWRFLSGDALAAGIEDAASDIVRIDAAISIATVASLVGFHRHQLEGARDWDEVLAELVSRWEHITFGD